MPIKEYPKIQQTDYARKNKSSVVWANFSEEEERVAKNIIEQELNKIKAEYDERMYFEVIENADEMYRGVKKEVNFPFTRASNKRINLLAMMCDIVSSRGKRQTCGVDPIIILEKDEDMQERELRDREDALDFILRKKVCIEELIQYIYLEAVKLPACVVKVPFVHQEEYRKNIKTYIPDSFDLDGRPTNKEFVKKYEKELLNSKSNEFKLWQKLRSNQEITIEEDESYVCFHGSKPYIVDLTNFYAKLSVKNFNNHIVIGERKKKTWADIEDLASNGYFDMKKVDELREKRGITYYEEDYWLWEYTVKADIKNEGKIRRYKIVLEEDSEIILRSIYFPFRHSHVDYIAYSGLSRHDSWFGYSFYERIEDVVKIAESFLNSMINEISLSHTPIVFTDDPTFSPNRITLDNLQVFRLQKGTSLNTMKFEYPTLDRMNIIQWALNFAELLTGVSASLASGKETPYDRNAPASKTAMKFSATNIRIEDIVHNLQKGDEELAYQVESNEMQYPESSNFSYEYYNKQNKMEVYRDLFQKKVRYVCHGSRISFDKRSDMMNAMQMVDFIMKVYPKVWEDVNVQYKMLDIILSNSEGTIEENKNMLLKPLKQMMDQRKMIQELMSKMQEEGRTDDDIKLKIRQILNINPQAMEASAMKVPAMEAPVGSIPGEPVAPPKRAPQGVPDNGPATLL